MPDSIPTDDAAALVAAATVADAVEREEGPMTANKRRIVEMAVLAFAQQGYDGTTTRVIARRAGVSEAAIFRHFPTKKELLLRLFRPLANHVVVPTGLDEVRAAAAQGKSLAEILALLLKSRLAFARRHAPLVRVMVQELPFHPELQDVVATQLPRLIAMVEHLLAERAARGEVIKVAPERLVRWFGSLFLGYFLMSTFTGSEREWDDEAEIAAMADLISRGIAQ
jgi:AcrR family transcriptional regulator